MVPKFDEIVWQAMTEYLQEWDKWRDERGRMDTPDYTRTEIYIIPLVVGLLKNAENAEKLNKNLFRLNVILTFLAAVAAIPIIKEIFGFMISAFSK